MTAGREDAPGPTGSPGGRSRPGTAPDGRAERVLVLDMNDVRPVWSMPREVVEELRAALPEEWSLRVVDAAADGSGDGVARVDDAVLAAVEGAEVYLGYGVPPEILRAATTLRWVHSGAAGVGGSLTPEMRASPVVFTNSAGIHGPPMAETVLAMLLHFARGLDFALRAQAESRWWKAPFYAADTPVREIAGSTVGLLGFGGVGREVARRVAALGARPLALKRTPPGGGDGGVELPGGGFLEVELLHGPGGLEDLLRRSDYLVVSAPETDETRDLLDAPTLARMKPGAVLINVARGGLVNEEALVAALRDGPLRGAGLDVFRTEPLPPEHPLWALENVVITPHVSGVSRRFWRRETDLILENLRRWRAGEELLNVVDKEAGY